MTHGKFIIKKDWLYYLLGLVDTKPKEPNLLYYSFIYVGGEDKN